MRGLSKVEINYVKLFINNTWLLYKIVLEEAEFSAKSSNSVSEKFQPAI